jgi:hypothetical protein
MAARLEPGDYDQLHHFIAVAVWDAAPLKSELVVQADRLVGGKDAVLVIDDTAMPKKGDRSVGVAPQYASSLATWLCETYPQEAEAKLESSTFIKNRTELVNQLMSPRSSRCPTATRLWAPQYSDEDYS